jgi:LysR family cys regulon transcriptional activator
MSWSLTIPGELVVATTHTGVCYVLRPVGFPVPGISQLHFDQIARQVQEQSADFAVASGQSELFDDLITLPVYHWERIIVVRPDHPLAAAKRASLDDLASFPIISYTHSFDAGSDQAKAFAKAGAEPNVVFSAEDPDVIKNYVRKGMGVGIIACMAYDRERDSDLVAINANHLFPSCTTWIGFRKNRFLRDYMYAFLELMVPGIDGTRSTKSLPTETRCSCSHGKSLSGLNLHPSIGNRFSSCCNGGFNL